MGRVKELLPDDWDGYDDIGDEPACDHDEFDIDILEGRAQCDRCGHAWYATSEQIEAQERHQQEYAEWEAEQHRHDNAWWRRLGRWLASLFKRNVLDSEIPF